MTDPHNSYDSDDSESPEDVFNKSRDFWSDRATRIVFRVVALVFLVFSVLFAFEIL